MEHRYVGILVNASVYHGIPHGRTRHEVLPYYEKAGKHFGIIPCYFRLQDMRINQKTIRAYVKGEHGYIRKIVPVPTVIHNRALYPKNPKARQQIKSWEAKGIQVFNAWNRYGKLQIQDILMEEERLRPHLPATVPASATALFDMMGLYDCLIIKPNSGSIGRGIMKLERISDNRWQLNYPLSQNGNTRRTLSFEQKLPQLLKRKLSSKAYMIQQRLPLATYKECPFDLRVSVQRNHTGQWQITGINGKVAKKNVFLTNVAQGATVYTFEQLMEAFPHLHSHNVLQDVSDFSLRVAQHLSNRLPHLADIGLDVGITEHGFPMFIECNGRDLRYSFKEGGLFQEWENTYANPIGYAHYLLEN